MVLILSLKLSKITSYFSRLCANRKKQKLKSDDYEVEKHIKKPRLQKETKTNDESDSVDEFEENTNKFENIRYNFKNLSKKCLREI